MQTTFPSYWKSLNIKKYDGSSDPNEHLDVYIIQVSFYTIDDVVLCRVFPTSLKGKTLHWFTCLTLNMINSFETLATPFGIVFHKLVLPPNFSSLGQHSKRKEGAPLNVQ